MDKRIKFILIGLIAVTIIFFLLFLQAASSKQQVLLERDNLQKINSELNSKTDELKNNLREYSNRIDSLNKELDKLSKEKQGWENKYELISQEREELVEKLKAKEEEFGRQAEGLRLRPAAEAEARFEPKMTDEYWANILKQKETLGINLEDISKKLEAMKLENENLKLAKTGLEFEIKNLTHDNADFNRQLELNQRLVDNISKELVREREDRVKTQQLLDKIKTENESVRQENKLLTQKLKKLAEYKIALEEKLAGLEESKVDVERKLDSLKFGEYSGYPQQRLERETTAVELPPIVVRPKSAAQRLNLREVEVLAVNPENNFVIINAGNSEGVKTGDFFQITRESRHIADVEVIQVRANIAACDIKKLNSPIKIGDKVR